MLRKWQREILYNFAESMLGFMGCVVYLAPMKTQNSNLRVNSFQEMNLSALSLEALEKMKITRPTDIQARAIPEAFGGVDLIAVAQTGSGKTLAFALPIVESLKQNPEARALILAPSREMAQQIHKVLVSLCEGTSIDLCLIIGGMPSVKQAAALRKHPRMIIATPGRLNDHLVGNKMLLQNVQHLVIDEADRMLDMGFAPQLRSIQKTLRGPRQTSMFSASFSPEVEDIAKIFMTGTPLMIRSAQAEEPVQELKQRVLFLNKSQKNDVILDELNATQKDGVIVFCGNQGSCQRLGQYLEEYGFSVDVIHGGLTQGQRNRVVRELREGETRIVVATDLLARGIDIPHVAHVINFDLPFQSEDFLHRIGRTARAGRGGNAITFVTSSDEKMFRKIKPYLQGAREEKLDPDFAFQDRGQSNNANRYKNKKLDQKKAFDSTTKATGKPVSKTLGRFDKPKKLSEKPKAAFSGSQPKSKDFTSSQAKGPKQASGDWKKKAPVTSGTSKSGKHKLFTNSFKKPRSR